MWGLVQTFITIKFMNRKPQNFPGSDNFNSVINYKWLCIFPFTSPCNFSKTLDENKNNNNTHPKNRVLDIICDI